MRFHPLKKNSAMSLEFVSVAMRFFLTWKGDVIKGSPFIQSRSFVNYTESISSFLFFICFFTFSFSFSGGHILSPS